MSGTLSWFKRFLLPGFAFKGFVIGGGYATGRELAEFFLPSGPVGGLMGMVLAMVLWSIICAATFSFAHVTKSHDYRTFFKNLLGPFWIVFEVVYVLFIVLILAVFCAAAGAIGEAVFGWPKLVGTLILMTAIMGVAAFGNEGAERLFKYASIFLYGVYAVFIVLAFSSFGDRILTNLAAAAPTDGWALGGVTYAGYNVLGAVVILPVLRHLTSQKDAVVAGAISGVIAMLPALLFFACMIAYYPEIGGETLPSDFLLRRMDFPVFLYAFQAMILIALLETSVGAVNAINERIASARKGTKKGALSMRTRLAIAATLLVFSVFLAERIGFVALIAQGYRAIAYVLIVVYVLPLMTFGMWRLLRRRTAPTASS